MAASVIKFGTDGWRAVMCEDFTVPRVRMVARAIAEYINAHGLAARGLVIGYDTRFFSERFAAACAEEAVAMGVKVYMPERPMPTPLTAFAIKARHAAGAIMITASHNPSEYNGIKFIPEYAGPASKEITDEIESRIESLSEADFSGQQRHNPAVVEHLDVFPEYLAHIESLVDFDRLRSDGLKVALDPLYGAAYGLLDGVFAAAGCSQVDTINNHRDPLFGGGHPEPSEERLADLRRLLLDREADLGLAVDGDADRFGALDYDGTYLTANQILSLVAFHLLKNKGKRGKVVRTVATTHLLDEIAAEYGCDLVETPVGFKHIAAEMLKDSVVVGGEESGGLSIGGHIPEKDGIIADLILAELLAYEGRPLGDVLKDIYQRFGHFHSERLDLRLSGEAKNKLINTMVSSPPERFAGLKVIAVENTDGVKYALENGDWVLARPSGTEPLVRVYVESKTMAGLQALKDAAALLVEETSA